MPKRIQIFLSIMYLLMGVHVGMATLMGRVKAAPPISQVRLSTQRDAVFIFGYNFIGLLTMKRFDTWSDATEYMQQNKLNAPELDLSQNSDQRDVKTQPLSVIGHKITWIEPSFPERLVIYTPDEASAQQMAAYLKHQGLNASLFGFSIALSQNN